jgi:hypothetical protein
MLFYPFSFYLLKGFFAKAQTILHYLIKNYYFIKLLLQEAETGETSIFVDKLSMDFAYECFHVSILRVIPKLLDKKDKSAIHRKSVDSMIGRMREIYEGQDIKFYNNLRNSYEWIILANFASDAYRSPRSKHVQAIESIKRSLASTASSAWAPSTGA